MLKIMKIVMKHAFLSKTQSQDFAQDGKNFRKKFRKNTTTLLKEFIHNKFNVKVKTSRLEKLTFIYFL